jgi:hypothetical protein
VNGRSWGFNVSEGGLELTAHGTQVGASEDTESPSEQGLRAPGRQLGDIREQLDTSAPVSRGVSRAARSAIFWDAPPGVCIVCGQPVTRVARESADEWAWIGEDGKQTGRDPDLARLEPDPYAYLAGLASRMGAARVHKRASLTPLYWATVREYSALGVRLDTGLSFHQHWARSFPWTGDPPPVHCGWSARWCPSGWRCRQCGEAVAGERAA